MIIFLCISDFPFIYNILLKVAENSKKPNNNTGPVVPAPTITEADYVPSSP